MISFSVLLYVCLLYNNTGGREKQENTNDGTFRRIKKQNEKTMSSDV